jgi:superfamily II DNA/RNA helicase
MIDSILHNLQITRLNSMQEAVQSASRQKDVLVLSPTGSGKTLAFLLATLERLSPDAPGVQALVLVPSRELALQIEQVFKNMGTGWKVTSCYGGHAVKTEENNLTEAPALLVGTPGRIAHHLRKGNFSPGTIHTLILDEFDKSLEMGFQKEMGFIIGSLHALSRRILTSATPLSSLPAFTGVQDPQEVNYLNDVATLPQLSLRLVRTEATEKTDTLIKLVYSIASGSTLIFCNHREAVERIGDTLRKHTIEHVVFHGGMDQPDRERSLIKFRNGSSRILVVTDLASRGLDIPDIESIIHYQLPLTEEAFIHRNGRTARMNATGTAYLLVAEDEIPDYLQPLPEAMDLPEYPALPAPPEWETLYVSAGRKDKISKGDIAGLLLKKGGLEKEELGLIEVKDTQSFAAVKRSKIRTVLTLLKQEKLKGKRIKTDIAN